MRLLLRRARLVAGAPGPVDVLVDLGAARSAAEAAALVAATLLAGEVTHSAL